MGSHYHSHTDELHVFLIPADQSMKMELKVVKNHWEDLVKLVDGYLEIVRPPDMPELNCGCMVSMVVNEDGRLHGSPVNPRASLLYPLAPSIVGDVILVGEGLVRIDRDGDEELDMFSLPPEFHHWMGPGHGYPTPAQPWVIDPSNGT